MKIDCQICNAPIDINVLVVPADGAIRGRCPSCDAVYVVRPPRKSFDLPSIRFIPSEKVERTCLRCGRVFRGDPGVSIPTCPDCTEEPGAAERSRPQRASWRVEKRDGSVFGPYSLEELARHIRERQFDRLDVGINSLGNRMALGNFSEFRSLFKEKKPFIKSSTPPSATAGPRPGRRLLRLGTALAAAAVLLFLGRTYLHHARAARRVDPRQLALLLKELPLPPLPWPAGQKFSEGEKALSRGSEEGQRRAALLFLDAFLTSAEKDPASQRALGLFLEALAGLWPQWEAKEQERLQQAVEIFLQQQPRQVAAWRARAVLRQQQGELPLAGQDLARALELAPGDSRSTYLFDLNQALMQKLNGATSPVTSWPLLQQASGARPYPAALLEGAALLDSSHRPGLAYRFRRQYLTYFPEEEVALIEQAKTLARLGQKKSALQQLQQILARHPEQRAARLAWLEIIADDPEYAAQALPALQYMQTHEAAQYEGKLAELRLRVWLATGQAANGLALLHSPLAAKIDAGLAARVLYAAGKKNEALDKLEKGGIASDHWAGLKLKAQLLEDSGQNAAALKIWQALQREFPERLTGYLQAALTLWQSGRSGEALATLSEALGRVGLDDRPALSAEERPLLQKAARWLRTPAAGQQAPRRRQAELLVQYLQLTQGMEGGVIKRALGELQTLAQGKDEVADLARLYLCRYYLLRQELLKAKELLGQLNGAGLNNPAYSYNATLVLAGLAPVAAVNQAEAVQSPDFPAYLNDYAAGIAYLAAGKRDQGIASLQKALSAHPDFQPAYQALFQAESGS